MWLGWSTYQYAKNRNKIYVSGLQPLLDDSAMHKYKAHTHLLHSPEHQSRELVHVHNSTQENRILFLSMSLLVV